MKEIKLTKRYLHSRTEDITDAFMRGYQQGKEDEHRWWSNFCANCKDADRKTEPQTERLCDKCEYYMSGEICGHPSIGEIDMGGKGDTFPYIKETPMWCPLKPQVSKIIEAYSKGFEDGAEAVKAMPQTEYKKWETKPSADMPTENTTCVGVAMALVEDDFFREPTAEERKAVAEYIDSISVPTGVNVFDLMDEPQTERSKEI